MSKFAKKFMLVVAILAVSVLALVGCSAKIEPLTGDEPAKTTNNDSKVVSHGDYIYFVNGSVDVGAINEADDNKYGNVIKGGIYRAKKDGTDVKVMVPQLALNSNGISIVGEYLYYTTPSTTKDKQGALQKSFTDVYRVKLDGQNPEHMITLRGTLSQYMFTAQGMFYLDPAEGKNHNNLMYMPYNDKKVSKPVPVDEKYQGNAVFSKVKDCDENGANIGQVVAYTKSPEELDPDGRQYNTVYMVSADGQIHEVMSGKVIEEGTAKTAQYQIKRVDAEGENIVMYYTKTIYLQGNIQDSTHKSSSLYAQKFDKDFKPVGGEIQLTVGHDATRYIDADKGVWVVDQGEMYIPNVVNGKEEKKISYKIDGIDPSNILDIRDVDGHRYMYYYTGSAVNVAEMKMTGRTKGQDGKYDDKDTGFAEKSVEVKNLDKDVQAPILIGDTLYYINSSYSSYLYTTTIAVSTDDKHITTATSSTHKLLGVRTKDDEKAYKDQVEGMDENTRKYHDGKMDIEADKALKIKTWDELNKD